MTPLEIHKLEELFHKKYNELNHAKGRINDNIFSEYCEKHNITIGTEKLNKPTDSICISSPQTSNDYWPDYGIFLFVPKELAQKILVLGLP